MLAALSAGIITLTGCGQNDLEPEPIGSLERAVGYTPERMERLVERHAAILTECMTSLGFQAPPQSPDPFLTLAPHGLFGRATPQAIRDYRLEYGYGMAQKARMVMPASARFEAQGEHEAYVWRLPAPAQRRYAAELDTCTRHATEATGGIDLATGGDLGQAFGRALRAMRRTDEHRAIERRVLDCLRTKGHDVERLTDLDAPFLTRIVELTGGSFETQDGRQVYRIGTDEGFRVRTADLEELTRDELAVAEDEVTCRDREAAQLEALLARYTGSVIREHRDTIAELRTALTRLPTTGSVATEETP